MKPKIEVIGLAGQKQNGKDEVADRLAQLLVTRPVSSFGHDRAKVAMQNKKEPWRRHAFADAVKDLYCQIFGKTRQFIEEWKEKNEPPPGMLMPVRQALTFIGDGFRKVQPDIWIETAFRDPWKYRFSILSDARYLNEAATIRAHKGFMVLVYRPGKLNFDANGSESEIRPFVQWCDATGREGAISQWEEFAQLATKFSNLGLENSSFVEDISKYDYFIRNEGTLDDLQAKVEILASYIKENYDYGED